MKTCAALADTRETAVEAGGCAPAVIVRLPDVVERPALALFLFERGMTDAEFGDLVGKTGAAVGNWCRPFSDPQRRAPRRETRELIAQITGGVVPPESFDPPAGPEGAE